MEDVFDHRYRLNQPVIVAHVNLFLVDVVSCLLKKGSHFVGDFSSLFRHFVLDHNQLFLVRLLQALVFFLEKSDLIFLLVIVNLN